ncbi:MAG: chromosome segregation protein SMC [Candidatus Micrarchaeota archaeon]|nr:chromosome segregation protein SMC [Candidatus Micrarchaeota archaeon]
MLYLESMILHRFKSFTHAELLLSKGFTCIIGPNGSGKSNIMDALLFVFGEPSMNRLRLERGEGLKQLINWKSPNTKIAYVTLNFNGDEKIAITKMVRSDGKTKYKVNGKKMSRKEVVDMLGKYNVRVDDTTTIAQDEISQYTKLNPKERRQLIDIAAGITEFEYKKSEAVKELDKVSVKVSTEQQVLNERLGFLKEIEKEKEAAENYIAMSGRLKSLRFSILFMRKEQLKASFEDYTKDMALLDSKKNEASYKADELSKKIDQINQESQHLTAELNKSSTAMSETNARREAVNKELTHVEAEILSQKKLLEDTTGTLKLDIQEKSDAAAAVKANASRIEQITKELNAKQVSLAALGEETAEDELGKIAETLSKSIDEDEAKLLDAAGYFSKLQSEFAVLKERQTDSGRRLSEAAGSVAETDSQRNAVSKSASSTKSEMKRLREEMEGLEGAEKKLDSGIGDIDVRLLNLREQMAMARPREGSTAAKLSSKFGEKDGFYGKAAELCSYDGKYATAVEVGAGSRLEYFIVDSISTANRIIKYLKDNGMGRATFMPIEDLRVEGDGRRAIGVPALIDFVAFDKRFSKVFEYVFNNTYVIDDIEDSKRLGIGRHRYVTMEGELVEQSGVVSGGSQRARLSLVRLESEFASQSATRANLKEQLEQTAIRLAGLRKEYAKAELASASAEGDARRFDSELKRYNTSMAATEKELKSIEQQMVKLNGEIIEADRQKAELAARLTANKNALKDHISKSAAKAKTAKLAGKHNAEKAKALRDDVEKLRIAIAQAEKENELLSKRIEGLSVSIKEKEKLAKETEHALEQKRIRKEVLDKGRVDIEYSIMHSNESSKKSLGRISELNVELEALSKERGRISAEIANLDRQISEIKIERGRSETRFNDVSAELAAYGQGIALVKGKSDEMESEANILESKLRELGNVNMKAPEVYNEKKKSVDDAQLKLTTLDTEKNAIMRMISEIESKKMQTFLDTLNEVNKNFMKMYNYVFPGKASLMLEEPKDPLVSGLKIQINNGETAQSLTSKSGGERTFISMMLIFAIHACKPSSMYIFDEIDKALDRENSKKLSLLVKQMSKDAQFLLVTHNDAMVVNADVAIGVTKMDGESKAVGLDLSKIATNNKH